MFPALWEGVNDYLQNSALLAGGATDNELITGFRSALDRSYSRICQAAADEWQRRFAGNDPSDACVSVRISSSASDPTRRLRRTARLQQLGSGPA